MLYVSWLLISVLYGKRHVGCESSDPGLQCCSSRYAGVALVVEGQMYLPSVRCLPSGGRLAALHLVHLLGAETETAMSEVEGQALFEACCRAEEADDTKQVPLLQSIESNQQ